MAALTLTTHDTFLKVAEAAPAPAPSPGLVRVSESYVTTLSALVGSDPYALVAGGDVALMGRYGGFWPADRVQLPTHAPSGFYSEFQHRVSIAWSRWLTEKNHLARGFLNHVPAYVGAMTVQWVRRGERPGAVSAGLQDRDGDGETDADPLVKDVQAFWEEWCEDSDWGMGEEDREKECRTRLIRDGNTILRFGAGGPTRNGMPWTRFVEPEQIRQPTGRVPEIPGYRPEQLDWTWGWCTVKDDAETVLGAWIVGADSGGGGGEFVPIAELCRMKANVDRTMKVGIPDFYPVEQPLQEALGILANCGSTAREQAGIAWVQEYATSTADQVRTLLSQGMEAYARAGAGVPAAQAPATGGSANFTVKQYGTTRVIHADANRQFKAGPTSDGVPSYMQVVEATMRGVGKLWGLENWFGSGGGSFAAELVEGGEFVTHVKDRQKQQIGFTKSVAMRVIELGERSGRLPAGTSKLVKPVVTAPPVVVADEEKQVRTWLSLYKENLADPTDIIKKRGGDPKQVAANILAWKAKFGTTDGTQLPPQPGGPDGGGGGPLPKDPKPAPPGSAGGDGTTPGGTAGDVFGTARESAGPHQFSCVYAELGGEARIRLLDLGKMIRDVDLAAEGRETEPHVTVRYGLHTENPADVGPVVQRSGPLALRLGAVGVFQKPGADVLVIAVEGDDLRKLHDALGVLPHTDKFATYNPHATIAYVKPGLGEIYARLLPAVSASAEVSRVTFSDKGNGRHVLPLGARVQEDASGLVTRQITVHRSDGTTYQQTRQVRAGDDTAGAEPTHAELHEQDRLDITGGIDRDIAALPESQRPPASVVAKAKDVALTAAAKAYLWAVRLSPAAQKLGELLGEVLDTPGDLGKLGYNPNTSSGTANPRTADGVSSALTDAIGVGVSGHLVASIASKVLVKTAYWAAKKARGAATESGADGVREWADMIAQLLATASQQVGATDPVPDADAIEQRLRQLLAHRNPSPTSNDESVGVTESGEVWFSDAIYERLSESGRAGLSLVTVTDKNGNQVQRWVRQGTQQGADSQRRDAQTGEDNHVVALALRDPAALTADHVKALADHAGGLNAESLRQLNLAFQQKIGGTKTELAKRLLEHVRGHVANRTVTTAAPPAARAAEVEFHGDSNKLFGGKLVELPDATVAAIGCAVDGAVVSVSVTRRMHGTDMEQPAATLNTSGPGVRAIRFLYRDGRGKLVCYNEYFKFTKSVDANTAGLSGVDLFVNQVRALRAAGVSKIKTFAAGDATDPGGLNGFYTWARFGYDGPIKKHVMKKLPPELARGMGKSNRLLKLFALPGGPEWWKKNGVSTSMAFDLRPGSANIQALEAYATRRKQQDART